MLFCDWATCCDKARAWDHLFCQGDSNISSAAWLFEWLQHVFACVWSLCIPSFPFISLHFPSFPFISLHFTSFHFISLHFTSFHFISLHFTSFHFISLHFTAFYFISFHLYYIISSQADNQPRQITKPMMAVSGGGFHSLLLGTDGFAQAS